MDSRALVSVVPRLRRYAQALVGDSATADDLVQDTLERAWTRAAQWRAGSDLAVWLLSIMHNLRIDQLRRPGLQLTSLDEEDIDVPTRVTPSDQRELADLAAALAQLPEQQRAVLLLVGLEELSYAEVAATLGIPMGTVMSRLARGRDRLRQILEGRQPAPRLRVVR